MTNKDRYFIEQAIEYAREGMNKNDGGPFGVVIVCDGKIIAKGRNLVTSVNDPTAHAEIVAIRKACETLGTYQLKDCILYSSCEPCPMCLGAIYWARPEKFFYAGSRQDAANAGFDDAFIYSEIFLDSEKRQIPGFQIQRNAAVKLFEEWNQKKDKLSY